MKRQPPTSLPSARPKRQATIAARSAISASLAIATSSPSSTQTPKVATTKRTLSVTTKTITTVTNTNTIPTITHRQARYLRILNSRLVNPPTAANLPAAAEQIASALVGVQAQEPTAGFLAIYKRIPSSLSGGAVSTSSSPQAEPSTHTPPIILPTLQSLITTSPPTLIRIWGQRGTLHIYSPRDWPLICASVGPSVSAARVASVASGNVTGKDSRSALTKALARAKDILSEGEQVTRRDMEGLGFDGRLFYSISMCTTLQGLGMRIDVSEGGESVLAPRVGDWETVSQTEALLDIAERYFTTYAPASEADFRYHFALTAGLSKPIVETLVEQGKITPVVVEGTAADEDGGSGDAKLLETKGKTKATNKGGKKQQITYIPTAQVPFLSTLPPTPHIPTLLLPRFDPLVLAHADKSMWIKPEYKPSVWTKNGLIIGTVLVDGQILGIWKYTKDGAGGMRVVVQNFESFDEGMREDVERQVEEYAGVLGLVLEGIVWDGLD
ncbi:hypothetical protein HDV00_001890 [Rhizophlyctis rosea]|nr:hypothetical protein HDV00_001890 [Rhizophlyctis rosea]